jgi:hypothetical protein
VRVWVGDEGDDDGAVDFDTEVMLDAVDGEVGSRDDRLVAEGGEDMVAGEERIGDPHISQLSSRSFGFCGVG